VTFLKELLADLAVDHLLHMGRVAEHEGQVEDVEVGNQRADRADADAGHGERADLRLLGHLLFAAELHRRIHLNGEPPFGGLLELLAHPHHGLHRGVPERVCVGGFEHHLGLRKGIRRKRRGRCGGTRHREKLSTIHSPLRCYAAQCRLTSIAYKSRWRYQRPRILVLRMAR
jgi:hypothetical protein